MKKFEWTGRKDPEDGKSAKRWHQVVRHMESETGTDNAIAGLAGFSCDLGVERNKGRIGAKAGPDAIRNALADLAWNGKDGTVVDFGNVNLSEADGDALQNAQNRLGDQVKDALQVASNVLVLGGGHETAAGSFDGLMKSLETMPEKRVGIINIDPHFDIRAPGDAGISSGTPFFQIHQALENQGKVMNYLCLGISETSNTKALFKRADEWGVQYMLDYEVRPHLIKDVYSKIDSFLAECDVLYLTIDLDVLPHWQMPAVSAPAPYGTGIDVVEDIIDYLGKKDIEWPLSDVVEFNPEFDQDGCAARVAARLCDKILRAMTE